MEERIIVSNGVPVRGYGQHGPEERRMVRVSGNASRAWLESAPPWFGVHRLVAWVPELIPGTVAIDARGEVTIASNAIEPEAARALEGIYRSELRDTRLVELERGRRYLTRNYVALDSPEAERHAELDHTPADEIEASEGVEIVHANGSWAFWSDGRVTTSIGLPVWATKARALSGEAARIIGAVYGSDSGRPACGYALLAQIAEAVGRADIWIGPAAGVYARESVEAIEVRMRDGSTKTLYQRTAGYCEGYLFEIGETLADVWPEGAARLQAQGQAHA
jgi:hypothetical protein